jgi:hypothetical protein
MKKFSIKLLWTAILAFTMIACTEGFEEFNKNPHALNDLDPGVQLTTVLLDLSGNREEVWRYDLGITSPKMQHLAGSWWTQHGGQYRVVERSHWFSKWETQYPREVKNIVDLVERTRGVEEHHNTHQAARIIRVYVFSRLTDLYGDIPYSEAGMGYFKGILQPRYDRQQDIYNDFFKELGEAVAALDATKGAVRGDLLFNGNVDRWKRFGNSLRLRLGFRLTKVDAARAQTEVTAALTAGVMTSNADIAMIRHAPFSFQGGGLENRGNGRSQVFQASDNSEGYRLTRTLVDFMKNSSDPRLTRFGGTYLGIVGGVYGRDITRYLQMGMEPGAMWWNLWADHGYVTIAPGDSVLVSHVNKFMHPSRYVAALDAPFFHLTFAEVELLRAEAIIRGWASGNAAATFHSALRAACLHTNHYPGAPPMTEDEITDFITANPFPVGFANQMEAIHNQMWVNFFLNGAEAFANWRRTGFPSLVPFTTLQWYTSGTGGVIPRRFFYPEFEAINNPVNFREAVDRMGGTDSWLTRVWWDAL